LARHVSFCFTLWSSSVEFYLFLIKYKKLVNEGCNWKRDDENGKTFWVLHLAFWYIL